MNKLEIIEEIEQTKRNKNKFDNLDNYYNKINSLYKQLSDTIGRNKEKKSIIYDNNDKLNSTDDEIISKIEDDLISHDSYSYILKKSNIKLLSKKYPLFDLFLIENNLIIQDLDTKYIIQTKPKIKENFDKNKIVSDIKFLLNLIEIVKGKINKSIISLIIFDTILNNFNICLQYKYFKNTVRDKLKEFKNEIDTFNNTTNKYGLGNNIIDELLMAFDN